MIQMFNETKLFFSQVITSLIPNDDFRGFDPLRPQVKLPPVMFQSKNVVFCFLAKLYRLCMFLQKPGYYEPKVIDGQ